MDMNEPLMIVVSHFWSDTLNTFLFSLDLMTITLADVLMLTGLIVLEPVTPFKLFDQTPHQLSTKDVGGCYRYISAHARTNTVDNRERTTFQNMWLENSYFVDQPLGQQPTRSRGSHRLSHPLFWLIPHISCLSDRRDLDC